MRVLLRVAGADDEPSVRALLARSCAHDDAAPVAREVVWGGGPGGTEARAVAALSEGALVGVAAACDRWIRVIAVDPRARGRGVGARLLAACEDAIRKTGAPVARTLDQPGAYLAPGVAADDRGAIAWLERRGYARVTEHVNLLVPVATAGAAAELAERSRTRGYRVRRARSADRPRLDREIRRGFPAAWAFEVNRAMGRSPPAVHIAVTGDGAPAGFAAHDGGARGWFGPAGTLPEHRGRGLGEALLAACLADLGGGGRRRATIAWIGPRRFYDRAVGVVGERRYIVLEKELPTR